MTRHIVSPVLAAIIAAGTGALILTTIPGDTFRDLAPACAYEDSPGPCYWNADTQGNGEGQSFYRDEAGKVHPQ